jgi:pilus assembly protein CpaC
MRQFRSALWGGLTLALLVGFGIPHAAAQTTGTPQVLVPLGSQIRYQMSTKKDIKTVFNPKPGSLTIRDAAMINDPTSVFVTGIVPDIVRVEFTDSDGKKETVEFLIQLDVEFVKFQLKRAVPGANVQVVPISANQVMLTGTVAQPQDIDIVTRVVNSIGGLQAINAMRVGGVQQVQLDVVVAQVSRREFRRMAFDFLVNSSNFFFGNTTGQAAVTPATIGTGGALSIASAGLNGGVGTPNGANTNIVSGVLHSHWGLLLFLQALRDEGLVKTLSEPRVVTLSGRPASSLVGGEQAIPVPAGLGQVGVQFVEFGTRLNFVPIVLGNGKIHLEVEPEISSLNVANGTSINGTVVPGRDTTRVNTTVQLESGQTFVIGGLIQHTVNATVRKTPVLGDMPFLGTMFSSKSFDEEEIELVILVTPHLVDAQDCSQLPKTLPGQETRSADDFELFLECIMEAPRGPRKIFNGYDYVPAYKNDPSIGQFPCGANAGPAAGGASGGSCAGGSCAGGSCGAGYVGGRMNGGPVIINGSTTPAYGPGAPIGTPLPGSGLTPLQQPMPLPSGAPVSSPVTFPALPPQGGPTQGLPPLNSPLPMPPLGGGSLGDPLRSPAPLLPPGVE